MTCKCRQQSSMHFVVWCDVCKNDLVSEKETNPNRVHIKIDNFKLEEDVEIINLLSRMAKGYEYFVEVNVNNLFGQIEGIHQHVEHAQSGIELCLDNIAELKKWINADSTLPAVAGIASRLEIIENLFNKDSTTLKYSNQNLRDACARIEKLEDLFAGRSFKPIHDALELHIEKFNERITELERWKQTAIEKTIQDVNRIKELEQAFLAAKERVEMLENHIRQYHELMLGTCPIELEKTIRANMRGKTPHKCPVCEGKGSVQTETEPKVFKIEFCKSCEGKGVLWG